MPASTMFEYYADWDGLADFGAEPTPMMRTLRRGGIREQPALEHVRQRSIAARGKLRIAKTAQLDRFGFTGEERRWSTCSAFGRCARRLLGAAQINERITRLLVYCLAITKQLELTAEEEAAHPRPRPRPRVRAGAVVLAADAGKRSVASRFRVSG